VPRFRATARDTQGSRRAETGENSGRFAGNSPQSFRWLPFRPWKDSMRPRKRAVDASLTDAVTWSQPGEQILLL
jgi:hypothetical protein